MKLNDTFHGITTLITVGMRDANQQATGFFYHRLASADPNQNPQWRKVERTWLVTNRHVVLPKIEEKEAIPNAFAFHLRRLKDNVLRWDAISLSQDELAKRARFHTDPGVDVCTIDVFDLLLERAKDALSRYQGWVGVHAGQLPGANNITVEVADEAVVIGYPRGFYDGVHLFPIVKSGIIASRWGTPFQGKPYFLIEAKLFPGSSGSIVVSKPQQLAVADGQIMLAEEKQFAFLGIYSGEPFWGETPLEFEDMTIVRKTGFNLGVVWYGHLIDGIIDNGVPVVGTAP